MNGGGEANLKKRGRKEHEFQAQTAQVNRKTNTLDTRFICLRVAYSIPLLNRLKCINTCHVPPIV